MEGWQIEYIRINLKKLTKFTQVNTSLLIDLKSKGVITDEEEESIVRLKNIEVETYKTNTYKTFCCVNRHPVHTISGGLNSCMRYYNPRQMDTQY